jgi:hypothetical protein
MATAPYISPEVLEMMGQMGPSMPSTAAASKSASASNWVTFDELVGRMSGEPEFLPGFGYSSRAGLSQQEFLQWGEMLGAAQEFAQQKGIQPDRPYSYVTDSGDFSGANYSPQLLSQVLKDNGMTIGLDPSRGSGKIGSSKGHTSQLGFLDSQGNVLGEFQVKEGSIGSGIMKGFVAPFARMILTGNAGAIGAAIAPTASATVQSAIGSAVASGAGAALSGGDAEDVIKNALIGGATGAIGEMVKPYVQDAIDFVKDLSPEGLENVVAAAEGAEDVAGAVTDVDVGGVGDVGAPAGVEQMSSVANFSPEAMQTYANEIAAGASRDLAYARAALVENQLQAAQSIYDRTMTPDVADAMLAGGSAPPVVNNLAGAATPVTSPPSGGTSVSGYGGAGDFQAIDVAGVGATTGVTNALTGGTVVPINAGGVADTLSTGMQEELGLTGAYTGSNAAADAALGLGAAGTAAGVAGAGAAAAGAAGAGAGTAAGAGGQMTAADLAGLDPNLTLGGGTDVLGGTDVTGGTGAIVTGAAGGAGAGAIVAGGAAAAGLTGIPVVDDFLNYIGTPAGAAALGAFGSLAGGYLTGQAAKDAANIQAQSAANALKLQREQFEYQKGLLEPYRARGESALNRLAGVMGLDGQPAQPQQLLDMDPGYAFRLGEGMKALERVQAARGNMLSGGAIKAGQRYAQDFASGEYGNAYNRLANIAGLGQTVGGQLGSAAQQFGQTAGETMSQGANALAAGRVGRTSGYMGGIGGAVGAYQNYQNQQQQNQLFRDIYGRMGG